VEPANALFGASAEEVAWARRIVAAFAEPAHAAANVINLDGRMVERLHLEEAQALLASIG
jgi:citrate lyase subunit beta/citryl-CoA lyase